MPTITKSASKLLASKVVVWRTKKSTPWDSLVGWCFFVFFGWVFNDVKKVPFWHTINRKYAFLRLSKIVWKSPFWLPFWLAKIVWKLPTNANYCTKKKDERMENGSSSKWSDATDEAQHIDCQVAYRTSAWATPSLMPWGAKTWKKKTSWSFKYLVILQLLVIPYIMCKYMV